MGSHLSWWLLCRQSSTHSASVEHIPQSLGENPQPSMAGNKQGQNAHEHKLTVKLMGSEREPRQRYSAYTGKIWPV